MILSLLLSRFQRGRSTYTFYSQSVACWSPVSRSPFSARLAWSQGTSIVCRPWLGSKTLWSHPSLHSGALQPAIPSNRWLLQFYMVGDGVSLRRLSFFLLFLFEAIWTSYDLFSRSSVTGSSWIRLELNRTTKSHLDVIPICCGTLINLITCGFITYLRFYPLHLSRNFMGCLFVLGQCAMSCGWTVARDFDTRTMHADTPSLILWFPPPSASHHPCVDCRELRG